MHPLAAPGALWVLSRAGKVPRPPAGGRNLPQEIDFLWMAREEASLLSSVSQGFASAEAAKGLSARPLETFGALLLKRMGGSQVNWFLVDGGEGGFLVFLCFAGFRLCGGDQRAFRSPFGNLRSPLLLKGTCKKFLVSGNEREPSLRFLFRGRQPRAPPQVVLSLS